MAEIIDAIATPHDDRRATQLLSVENDYLVGIAESADRRIAAIKKIKGVVLALTNSNDWTDQNGKPYLQASGLQKVAGLFGVSWVFVSEPKKVVEEDGHYRYDVTLAVTAGNRTIEVIGSRSSKDPFFCTRYRGGERIELPPTEVDGGDVLKAAITNAQAVGISALLGIRNMTWEELAPAGIVPDKTSRVEYAKREMSEEGQEQKQAVLDMLLEIAGGDEERVPELLERMTGFTGSSGAWVAGKRDISKLSEKALNVTYGRAKTARERYRKQHERNGKNGVATSSKPTEAPAGTPGKEASSSGRLV